MSPQKATPVETHTGRKRKAERQQDATIARASKQPDLAAQVAELHQQIASLREAVEHSTPFTSDSPPATAAEQPPPPSTLDPRPSTSIAALSEQIAALGNQLSTLVTRSSSPATSYPPTVTAAPPLVYELKETRPVGYQSSDLLDSSSEESQDGFYTGLLDRARMQWLMGDLIGLATHNLDAIQSHPRRADLALLCACAHAQVGSKEISKKLFAYAYEWGADKRLVFKTLAGGLHYSLGRAAYLAGRTTQAFLHADRAAVSGFAGLGNRIHSLDGAAQKIRALGFDSSSPFDNKVSPLGFNRQPEMELKSDDRKFQGEAERLDRMAAEYISRNQMQEIAGRLRMDARSRSDALASASSTLKSIIGCMDDPLLAATNLDYDEKSFLFTHIQGDYIPAQIISHSKFYESDFLETLGYLHSGNGIIIDVGANIGNHTIYFASVLGAKVIAIEPEPHNYFCLALNSLLNAKRETIHCWNMACGKKEGRIALEMKLDNNFGSFTSSLEANPQSTSAAQNHRIEVPIRRLDSLLDSKTQVSILKIDVEGMEAEVLDGAVDLINRSIPVIAVECFTNSVFLQISAKLRCHGYFPAQVLNWTPTFIFLSTKNPEHLHGLKKLLGQNAIKTAIKNEDFAIKERGLAQFRGENGGFV